MLNNVKIAIDAMGSDHGPRAIVSGAALSKQRNPGSQYIFFGDKKVINAETIKYDILDNSYEIVDTKETIRPEDKPSQALRKMKNTSMGMSLEYLSEKNVDAVVSAGNTGALMGMARMKIKTLSGILRPAIAATLPHSNGEFVLLDLGANTVCNADNLLQFAIMGTEFAKVVLGKPNPKVAILNIGTEQEKGKEFIHEAAALIKKTYINNNFIGYVEGNEITKGIADVVVTDGFSGNIALKTAEGVANLCSKYVKSLFSNSLTGKISYLLMKKPLATLKDKLDPRKRNGALFLGLNGIVVKSHGGADDTSFAAAIDIAFEFTQEGVGEKIIKGIHDFK